MTASTMVGGAMLTNCAICGDRATGKHYGASSCDGCKGIFFDNIFITGYNILETGIIQIGIALFHFKGFSEGQFVRNIPIHVGSTEIVQLTRIKETNAGKPTIIYRHKLINMMIFEDSKLQSLMDSISFQILQTKKMFQGRDEKGCGPK